ncbi:MAG: TfoX/Sxy family protein [Candidatus Dormibacteraeota bacterium]|nr:TfoX/Sxy family protein [Candidatus Dormibacteraeota bacterium]
MSYDEALAARVRALLAGEEAISEKRMFGGLAFLLEGNMAVAASGNGGLLVRVDPAEGERLIASTAAVPMAMRGREMAGWLRIAEGLESDRELETWVRRGVDYARSLPPKAG